MKDPESSRFAERALLGIDDAGNEERVLIWIEYRPDALWAVGRIVNPQLRSNGDPRDDDYIFQGYELDDAISEANGALSDDLRVSSEEGIAQDVTPFSREEILVPLERWFFRHGEGEEDGAR
jgi:hypothetical protein